MSDNGKLLGVIVDGYTQASYVNATPRLHPAVRFTFRPVLAQDRAVIYRNIANANDPRKEETMAAQAIAARVVEWDLVDGAGKTVEFKPSAILAVKPYLLNRLFKIVMGDMAGDEDPRVAPDVRDAGAEADFKLALSGGNAEEADAKNSVAG